MLPLHIASDGLSMAICGSTQAQASSGAEQGETMPCEEERVTRVQSGGNSD